MELERYWNFRPFKWHWGVALFFFVRYVGVWGHVPVLISTFLKEHNTPVSISGILAFSVKRLSFRVKI